MNGGKGSQAPVRVRHYSPKEFSAELSALGIRMHETTIRFRCTLPVGHVDRIATNALFSGRHLIPETELDRLCGSKAIA